MSNVIATKLLLTEIRSIDVLTITHCVIPESVGDDSDKLHIKEHKRNISITTGAI